MALFKPEDQQTPIADAPTITGPAYRTTIADSEFKNQYSFYSLVNGTPVSGSYYRGYLSENEDPLGFQPNNYAVYQSYTKINRMVIKVDGDPGFMYDAEMAEASETFQAFVFFDLTPIIGDLFIKDMGDGRTGMWQIIRAPELRNYSAIKVYQCEFKLLGYVNETIQHNLDSKTVEEYVYSADSLLNGGNAIITTKQFEQSKDLTESGFYLAQYLLQTFYWEAEQTIALQDDVYGWIYDPGLATFLKDVIPGALYGGRPPIVLPSYRTGTEYATERRLTVWDILRHGSFRLSGLVNKEYNIYPRSNFFSTRNYLGFESTRFDHIIIPGDVIKYGVINQQGIASPTGFGYRPQVVNAKPYEYYFSKGFYEGKSEDPFESYVIEFFMNKHIDRVRLLQFYDEFPGWSKRDQLYRGGILLTMILISRKVTRGW